jgi:hypothetical protein
LPTIAGGVIGQFFQAHAEIIVDRSSGVQRAGYFQRETGRCVARRADRYGDKNLRFRYGRSSLRGKQFGWWLAGTKPRCEDSTLNAAPFEHSEDSPLGDVLDSAARAVSEPDEAHCFAQYERDLDMCNALYTAMGGSRGAILCRQNAFDRHQQCRGF